VDELERWMFAGVQPYPSLPRKADRTNVTPFLFSRRGVKRVR
jgi:hypothetical protein